VEERGVGHKGSTVIYFVQRQVFNDLGGGREMEKMNLEQARERYAGQWLAFLVTEEAPTGGTVGQIACP